MNRKDRKALVREFKETISEIMARPEEALTGSKIDDFINLAGRLRKVVDDLSLWQRFQVSDFCVPYEDVIDLVSEAAIARQSAAPRRLILRKNAAAVQAQPAQRR